jgi:transposase
VENPARLELELAATDAEGKGAGRDGHQAMGGRELAAGKKNARRQRAWIIFQDETGITERPPVRSTWAPKGQTPVLTHPYNWNKLSVAGALAYRWDGRRCRFLFRTIEDNFKATDIIVFLKTLKRHLRGRKVILIWDRLPGHKARITQQYLLTQRHWLKAEWLPAYAPDLNPTEYVWGHSKAGELANQPVEDLDDVADALRRGLRRVTSRLGFAFLRHAGLSLA